MIHAWVLEEWPCSELEWATQGTRYLGMEVLQRHSGAFEIHQRGYIMDLLRAHDMVDAPATQRPCPKEWITDDVPEEAETFSESELRFGQRVVGEQLWLTMRSRPDLQFIVGHMAQYVSKHPRRVARIAKRVLAYLVSTMNLKLVLGDSENSSSSCSSTTPPSTAAAVEVPEGMLVGYSDSSFSPYGGRSYGASVITVAGSPVAWKSGKQAMVTLSIMESELLEATTAATLLEGIGCLLDELYGRRVPRELRVDNSAATAMIAGGAGSWRTRHLKVRSAYVREQVQHGLLIVKHVEGKRQLADLATKMHPRMRLLDLLSQWRFEGLPEEAAQLQIAQVILMSCLVVALERVPRGEAAGSRDGDNAKDPIKVSGMDELLLVAGVVAVCAVIVWELIKFLGRWCSRSLRKQTKLQRLRDLARLTAELEIERIQAQQQTLPTGQDLQGAVHEALSGTRVREGRPSSEPERAHNSRRTRSASTELDSRLRSSPGACSIGSSRNDDVENTSDRTRLCRDVLGLLTCEALKVGLRTEALTVSGLKPDQVARLSLQLVPDESFRVVGRDLPSDRQLRYILWLWRHRHLNGRCALAWSDVYTKEAASRWIHKWKDG